ncbi:MAG TPA: DUF167 domain-containing protein [Candidatus Saccharimonadales bacterium]|nr:DUF167 domain-containing protein [Candidatus Saccharimonadales bacterium]
MQYTVHVKPGSKKGPLVEQTDAGFTVYVRERAVDGRANQAVIELLAEYFGVAKSRIEIVRGHTSRTKVVRVAA